MAGVAGNMADEVDAHPLFWYVVIKSWARLANGVQALGWDKQSTLSCNSVFCIISLEGRSSMVASKSSHWSESTLIHDYIKHPATTYA